MRKRKETQQKILVEYHNEVYTKSIMWKFFIQKKRKFSELNFNPMPEEFPAETRCGN